jgi:integrase
MCTSVIGLDPMTTNKHIRKLKQIYNCARAAIPAMSEVNFDKFLVPDLKDARDRRDAYTPAQGVELFSLAPFSGCQSVKNRLEPGSVVIHDALFFVPLIVWYTGMRREEVCKLLVSEVLFDEGVWHFSIKHSEAGGIKNLSSRRLVAIADELVRLGLIGYLEAVRAAGHEALFPELVSERKGAKKGDVFYKIWWMYLATLMLSLKRGQALHAIRHSFDTELKALEVSPEARADTTGHAMKGLGETRTYSKATKLTKILELVNMVPIVSGHLANCASINLLPAEMRVPRPTRQKAI